jgi:hypothetical protein
VTDRPALPTGTGANADSKWAKSEAGCLTRRTLPDQLYLSHLARVATQRASQHTEIALKFSTIAILAAAATFFAASLASADRAPRRGHNAYGSTAPLADASSNEPDRARASALRQCNNAVANMFEYAWGVQRAAEYRACMTSHGQVE